jgi:hypothetical protein
LTITRKRLSALLLLAALAALVPTALLAQVATSLDVADNEAFGPTVISVPGASHGTEYYIVIHEGDAEAFGGVVGFSPLLPPGAVSNYRVQLNRPIVDGEHLWPMLHTDGNGNGVYDDPSTDPPVIDASAGNASFGGVLVFRMQVSTGENTPSTQQPAPSAADTGNAGILAVSEGFEAAEWLALFGMTLVLVGGGALATRRS